MRTISPWKDLANYFRNYHTSYSSSYHMYNSEFRSQINTKVVIFHNKILDKIVQSLNRFVLFSVKFPNFVNFIFCKLTWSYQNPFSSLPIRSKPRSEPSKSWMIKLVIKSWPRSWLKIFVNGGEGMRKSLGKSIFDMSIFFEKFEYLLSVIS